jgi:hypothetical protein
METDFTGYTYRREFSKDDGKTWETLGLKNPLTRGQHFNLCSVFFVSEINTKQVSWVIDCWNNNQCKISPVIWKYTLND